MATKDFTATTQETKLIGTNKVKAQNTLDFSVTNVTTSDTCLALKIPAAAILSRTAVRIDTAETGLGTLGDGDNATGWMTTSQINLNATAGTTTFSIPTGTYPALGGKYYAAADTLDLVTTAAMDSGKVTVVAEYSVLE